MLSFGDPRAFAAKIKAAGALLLCQVQTLAHVADAPAAGADIIVAQGGEAGGHGGNRATLPFVPEVADILARRAPTAMAAAALPTGAALPPRSCSAPEGVLAGTRFHAGLEALAHPEAKAYMTQARGDATIRTTIIDIVRDIAWPDGVSMRVMRRASSSSAGTAPRWRCASAKEGNVALRGSLASGPA
jgi:nitronate monooxygenase